MAKPKMIPQPKKNTPAGQRDRGGYNRHGHKHPQHLGRMLCDDAPKSAQSSNKADMTPQTQKKRG